MIMGSFVTRSGVRSLLVLTASLTAMLPLGVKAAAAAAETTTTRHGKATFYMLNPNDPVACQTTGPVMLRDIPTLAAVDKSVFDRVGEQHETVCGRCMRVRGPHGTITVRIVDRCEGCGENGVDLSYQGFPRIAEHHDLGRVDIAWDWVDCESGAEPPAIVSAPQAPAAAVPPPPGFAVDHAPSPSTPPSSPPPPPPTLHQHAERIAGAALSPSEEVSIASAKKVAARIATGLGTTSLPDDAATSATTSQASSITATGSTMAGSLVSGGSSGLGVAVAAALFFVV